MVRLCILIAATVLLAAAHGADAAVLVTLHSFCSEAACADGSFPQAGLVRDQQGNLYGTALQGGAHGDGVAFELERRGRHFTYAILHSFCRDCGDGAFPGAGLIVDGNGNLYGTTEAGGAGHDCGTVFRLSRGKIRLLHSFCELDGDGDTPTAGLSYFGQATGAPYDGESPLYGTTGRGGAHNFGTVFQLRPKGWRMRTLYAFCGKTNCSDGAAPAGEVAVDASGNLFGAAFLGGASGRGAIYEIARKTETVLYDFCPADCADGSNPNGALLEDEEGSLFGTALNTGSENGVVFKLAQGAASVLHTFCADAHCTDGYAPSAGMIANSSGDLFGTTAFGGTGENGVGGGTIFRLRGTALTTLYNFCSLQNCADGRVPASALAMDGSGELFGTTPQGGAEAGAGTVFELRP